MAVHQLLRVSFAEGAAASARLVPSCRADVKVGMHGSTVTTGSVRKRKLIHAWLRTRVRSMHECSFVVHGLPSPTLAFEFLNALLMLKHASKQFTLWQHCHIAVGFSDVFTPPLRLQFKAIRSRRFDAHPGNVDDTLNAQWIFKQHLVKLLYWGQGRRNRGQRSGVVRSEMEESVWEPSAASHNGRLRS